MQNEHQELVEKALESVLKLINEKKLKDAELVAHQILKMFPENKQALQLMGLIYYQLNSFKRSLEVFLKAAELEPNGENFNNISLCYAAIFQRQLALDYALKAVELNPCFNFLNNLGLRYGDLEDFPQAEITFKQALDIEKNYLGYINLGNVYGRMLKIDNAIESFKKALELNPEFPDAHVGLSYCLFLKGNFSDSWAHYEYRLQTFKQIRYIWELYGQEKAWKGENLTGKNLLVYCEQGAGDLIHFYRFLPKLKNCNIFLHTPPELISLLNHNPIENVQIAEEFPREMVDYTCSIMSLPYFLKLEHFTGEKYLNSFKKANFSQYQKDFKIGIAWAGNPRHPNDSYRSCKLSLFSGIHDIPGVKLFSLQKDLRLRAYLHAPEPIDLGANCEYMKIVDMSEHLGDFDDTAAFIEEMDLIITVDTSLAHLAGALGKKVWMLLPYQCDWRWGLESEKTVWYDSATLFRQKSLGDWLPVFSVIEGKLNEILLPHQR